jgi:hypothetical protein
MKPSNNPKNIPEPYMEDTLQVKIKQIQRELENKMGTDFLKRITDYTFYFALEEAKRYELEKIPDELYRNISFNRLFRFRTEQALITIADYIQGMIWQGYSFKEIKHYLSNPRIPEVVVFEI